eukprot:scaffold150376_cov62-Cyclotella_meneghiniana.AAC.4
MHAVSSSSNCRCILSDLFAVDLVSKEGVVNRTDRTYLRHIDQVRLLMTLGRGIRGISAA